MVGDVAGGVPRRDSRCLGQDQALFLECQRELGPVVLGQQSHLVETGVENEDGLQCHRHITHHPPAGARVAQPWLGLSRGQRVGRRQRLDRDLPPCIDCGIHRGRAQDVDRGVALNERQAGKGESDVVHQRRQLVVDAR